MILNKPFSFRIRSSLTRKSLIARLVRAAHYDGYPVTHHEFQDMYGLLVTSLLKREFSLIEQEIMTILDGEREIYLPVDLSNTQLMGADLCIPSFSKGYEPDILALMSIFLPRDGVFIDGGTNWGYFPVHLLADPLFTGTVHAFEPGEPAHGDLLFITSELEASERLIPHKLALGDKAGEAILFDEAWSGNRSLIGENKSGATVQIVTLDSIIEHADFIKLDLEGYEYQCLIGMANILSSSRSVVVFESWCRSEAEYEEWEKCFNYLTDHGYDIYMTAINYKNEQVDYSIGSIIEGDISLTPLRKEDRHGAGERINVLSIPSNYNK